MGVVLPSLLLGEPPAQVARADRPNTSVAQAIATPNSGSTRFLVVAGGGAPSYNEIALEKNVLYFQRTLNATGQDSTAASVFFANGNTGQATVRYLDTSRQERFKAPAIPNLSGAATIRNFRNWVQQAARSPAPEPIFFYFTGHGAYNEDNDENNALILWQEYFLSVQELAGLFDQLPDEVPVATMMAQCYAGSFANLIYEGGDPSRPVDPQNRCGFFATVKTRPSVGCTPEVNEADYRDYSSSFFAGLSGVDRVGNRVASADYDQNGVVAYAEAHAFAKVDGETSDWPVSTSEIWLQRQVNPAAQAQILQQPIAQLLSTARPEQRYVVQSLAQKLGMNLNQSYTQNAARLGSAALKSEVEEAYAMRLQLELINIGAEQQVRNSGNTEAIALLERLLECEFGTWVES